MSEFLDYLRAWSVLKWVILLLVAGFIGQFGRMMGPSPHPEGAPGERYGRFPILAGSAGSGRVG